LVVRAPRPELGSVGSINDPEERLPSRASRLRMGLLTPLRLTGFRCSVPAEGSRGISGLRGKRGLAEKPGDRRAPGPEADRGAGFLGRMRPELAD